MQNPPMTSHLLKVKVFPKAYKASPDWFLHSLPLLPPSLSCCSWMYHHAPTSGLCSACNALPRKSGRLALITSLGFYYHVIFCGAPVLTTQFKTTNSSYPGSPILPSLLYFSLEYLSLKTTFFIYCLSSLLEYKHLGGRNILPIFLYPPTFIVSTVTWAVDGT